MKRTLCILFSMLFVVCLCSCKKDDNKKKSTYPVDIEYYAKLGKIKECPYALGTKIDELEKALLPEVTEETTEEELENGYSAYEDGDLTRITGDEKEYVYRTDQKDQGVLCIVDYSIAYEFDEAPITDVKAALEGHDFTEHEVTGENFFFLPDTAQVTLLEYKIGKNTLDFLFYNDILSVTVIYSEKFTME